MAITGATRKLTDREEASLSRYYVAHEHYEAMRLLLRYEDLRLVSGIAFSGKRVLELGCGSLPLLIAFPNPDFAYVGTDFSESGLRLARRLAPRGYYLVCDAMLPALSAGQFDVVIMKNLLHHLERPVDCLRAVRELLAPGGTLLVLEPNSRCIPANILKAMLRLLGRPLEESPYGQLKVGQLATAFCQAGFGLDTVHHSGLLAFPASGDYGSLRVLPMWVGLWRGIIALDRTLSRVLLSPSWLAPLLGFKVVFRLRP